MKGTLRPGRKAGVLALAVLLLTCVLMAGAVSAVENNYYQVPDCGWNETHNITAEIPSASGTWVNFTDIRSAITYARPNVSEREEAVFYCKPKTDLGAQTHTAVNFSFTIYGNGAYISGGERDFSIDSVPPKLTSNINLKVYNLTNMSFWGARSTGYTLNLFIDGCTLEGGEGYPRIYLTGATGSNNIQIQNTKFLDGSNSVVYSNAPGNISLKNCVFTNNQVPVNINHKATSGTLKVTIENCSFINCGKGNSSIEELYSAPIRVVNSQNENTAVSVEIIGCSFNNPESSNGDILLGEGRINEPNKGVIIATITDLKTDADLQVQNPGDRTTTGSDGYERVLSKGTNYAVSHTGSGEPQVDIILPPEPEPQPPSSSSSGNMDNAYRVLFNDGSTTLSVVTDLSSGDKLTKPETPVKDGYTFAGWYKDSACTQAWDFETGIPGDMTLYAKWTTSGETEATATPTKTQTAVTTPQPTKTQTVVATTSAPQATTAIAVSPTLTQAPAPAAGALFGLLAAGLLLRRRN